MVKGIVILYKSFGDMTIAVSDNINTMAVGTATIQERRRPTKE